MATLTRWCGQRGIFSGFMYGLGGVQSAELGYYDLEQHQYHWHKRSDVVEILSLQGSISQANDDQAFLHVHATLGTDQLQAIGGHVKQLIVGGTAEIKLIPGDDAVKRQDDADTGLSLLDLEHTHPGAY